MTPIKPSRLLETLLLLPVLLLPSCAAIFDGSTDRVTIQSDPPGVKVRVDGTEYTTPVTVELATAAHHTVSGPHGETYPIRSMPNRLAVFEALLILPIPVDLLVGAYTTLEPSVITLSSGTTPLADPARRK